MLARRAASLLLPKRLYSAGEPPVSLLHAQVQDAEQLFARHRLDRVSDTSRIDELEAAGAIPAVMAGQLRERIKRSHEAQQNGKFWRRVTIFIGFPLMLAVGYNTYLIEMEHAKYLEEHPPEMKKYSYMRWRAKKFFWGDGEKTLFHNDKYNL